MDPKSSVFKPSLFLLSHPDPSLGSLFSPAPPSSTFCPSHVHPRPSFLYDGSTGPMHESPAREQDAAGSHICSQVRRGPARQSGSTQGPAKVLLPEPSFQESVLTFYFTEAGSLLMLLCSALQTGWAVSFPRSILPSPRISL